MDTAEFWEIISDVNRAAVGDMDGKVEALTTRLQSMDADRVLAFSRVFDSLMDKAYTWDLWAAAYMIQGGCSDDGFMDFRSSLISLGRETFEQAVSSPETLADMDATALDSLGFEGFAYPPTSVYQEMTGTLPEYGTPHPKEPAGQPWDEDEGVLAARFPKLWSRYGRTDTESRQSPPAKQKPWWKFW